MALVQVLHGWIRIHLLMTFLLVRGVKSSVHFLLICFHLCGLSSLGLSSLGPLVGSHQGNLLVRLILIHHNLHRIHVIINVCAFSLVKVEEGVIAVVVNRII